MTDVLLLGGTGWLGSRIAERWLDAGASVTCLVRGGRDAPYGARLDVADRDDPAAAETIRTGLGTDLTPAMVDEMRELLVRLGAVENVERRITDLTESALAALSGADISPDAADRLVAMAHAATRRTT